MTVSAEELAAILAGIAPPAAEPEPAPAAAPEIPRSQWPMCLDPKCGAILDPLWHEAGLHPDCVAPEPPSTVAELRTMLIDHDANSARSLQRSIGPSEIGVPCDRQLGMRLHNIPQRADARVPWAPIQGTAVHAYLADVLLRHNELLGRQRWIVEERVYPDDEHPGSGDAYDCDNALVADWKIIGPNSLKKYRKTVRPEYRAQAHLYGYGHERAGRPVRWVRLVYLARSHDFEESFEWTEAYDPEIAIRALDRLYAIADLTGPNGLDVVTNPALWAAVPALPTPDCRWCRYFRPGKPADNTGCPGDAAAAERYASKFTDGLIAP